MVEPEVTVQAKTAAAPSLSWKGFQLLMDEQLFFDKNLIFWVLRVLWKGETLYVDLSWKA